MSSEPVIPSASSDGVLVADSLCRAQDLHKAGLISEAIAVLEDAAAKNPDNAAILFELGTAFQDANRFDDAESCWKRAVELYPTLQQSWRALAALHSRFGRLAEAIEACERAIKLNPKDIASRLTLASSLHFSRQFKRAVVEYDRLMQLDPWNASAMNNYGNLLVDIGQPAKAVHFFRAALAINPDDLEIHTNLGNVLKKQGRLDEAIACYERTLRLRPEAFKTHSNLLLLLNSLPAVEQGLLKEHEEWARRHASRFYPTRAMFRNDTSNRRLRIGYVSPDFRRHSVGYFIRPILTNHDRNSVEVFCYSDVSKTDRVTESLRQMVEHWCEITGHEDEQVAEQIRHDEIDVLVDLAGHTARNRLLVFARRAAPVQVTYLGYPNTTGLATMDYRLTDAKADPPGMTDAHYVETLFRLPECFLCYQPPYEVHSDRLDGQKRAKVTFGCFNNLAKMNAMILRAWAQILRAVPESILLMKADGFADEQTRLDFSDALADEGVDASRLRLLPRTSSFAEHMAMYRQIDIALDTFPYNGTTTTCEALYMGVPVITLAGNAHLSRVGCSLLTAVGLPNLIAHSMEEYVEIAATLAKDWSGRRGQLDDLRQKLLRSPLTDGRRFTADLERAYRQMWHAWSERNTAAKFS
jgi:protein O-GlcNAc transferase